MNNALIDKTKATRGNFGKLASVGLAAAVLATALGAAAPAEAAPCRSVIFAIENNTGQPIEIDRVSYFDNNTDPVTQRTENVRNEICISGTCNTQGDNLGSAFVPIEGNHLNRFRIEYRTQNDRGRWRNPRWTREQAPTGFSLGDDGLKCRNGLVYGTFQVP